MLAHSSTVRVAVRVNRLFLRSVDASGDENGSRFPPVVPFSLHSPDLMAVIAWLAINILYKERHTSSHCLAGCAAQGGAYPYMFVQHYNLGGMPW